MKLFEIIDFDKVRPVKYKGAELFPASGDIVGRGSYAKVHQSGPNTVTKIAEIEYGDRDPIVLYLKECVAHPNNPFFPKIKHAKLYSHEAPNGLEAQVMIVQMEKLQELNANNLRQAVLSEFGKIGLGLTDKEKQYAKMELKNPTEQQLHEKYLDVLMAKVYGVFDMEMSELDTFLKQVNNPHFTEAVWTLDDLLNNEDLVLDMHYGNWMVRTTGKDPHLVITDPFEPFNEKW